MIRSSYVALVFSLQLLKKRPRSRCPPCSIHTRLKLDRPRPKVVTACDALSLAAHCTLCTSDLLCQDVLIAQRVRLEKKYGDSTKLKFANPEVGRVDEYLQKIMKTASRFMHDTIQALKPDAGTIRYRKEVTHDAYRVPNFPKDSKNR